MTGFTVLGAVGVTRNGVDVGLGSAPQRRLLGLLCSRANSVVAADRLAEQLGLTPGALRTSISRLRAVVGTDVLRTLPPGYMLRTDGIDAQHFEQMLADAAAATSASAAQHSLQAALRLWRGDAYAEFAHEPWATTEAARLESLRAGATEELCELALEAKQWTNAIALISPLIATEPFSDRPRGQLMRALAGSGRRASALRAFHDYRRFLAEETGTEPSAELVALDRLIAADGALPIEV